MLGAALDATLGGGGRRAGRPTALGCDRERYLAKGNTNIDVVEVSWVSKSLTPHLAGCRTPLADPQLHRIS